MQQPKPITAGMSDKPHPATVDQTSTRLAIAIIGAELIAYRVNRKPEQRARLLGLVQMANTLGVLSTTDRATVAASLNARGAA